MTSVEVYFPYGTLGFPRFPVLYFYRLWDKTLSGEMPIFSLYCFSQP